MTNERGRNCYLFRNGLFFGMDMTAGILFSGENTPVGKLLCGVRSGDLFFCCSPDGVAAVGIARKEAFRTPFPAWRYRDAKPGERGLTVDLDVILLARPIPLCPPLPEELLLCGETLLLSLPAARALIAEVRRVMPVSGWLPSVFIVVSREQTAAM